MKPARRSTGSPESRTDPPRTAASCRFLSRGLPDGGLSDLARTERSTPGVSFTHRPMLRHGPNKLPDQCRRTVRQSWSAQTNPANQDQRGRSRVHEAGVPGQPSGVLRQDSMQNRRQLAQFPFLVVVEVGPERWGRTIPGSRSLLTTTRLQGMKGRTSSTSCFNAWFVCLATCLTAS
jgi:hypothetical protein